MIAPGCHVEQLESLPGIEVDVRRDHAHLSDGVKQFAVFRVNYLGNFDRWGWVEIANGRADVHDWDEFLAALAVHAYPSMPIGGAR